MIKTADINILNASYLFLDVPPPLQSYW